LLGAVGGWRVRKKKFPTLRKKKATFTCEPEIKAVQRTPNKGEEKKKKNGTV
jgi:hypothetical protein